MACACKSRKSAGQVTAVKQVAKKPVVSTPSRVISKTKTTRTKRVMFRRPL